MHKTKSLCAGRESGDIHGSERRRRTALGSLYSDASRCPNAAHLESLSRAGESGQEEEKKKKEKGNGTRMGIKMGIENKKKEREK